jgi:hypothetical protein
MLANNLPLGGDDNALGIDPYTNGAIGEGRWHAVAIAIQMNQACRRDSLGVFDEPVKWPGKLHQMLDPIGPSVGY